MARYAVPRDDYNYDENPEDDISVAYDVDDTNVLDSVQPIPATTPTGPGTFAPTPSGFQTDEAYYLNSSSAPGGNSSGSAEEHAQRYGRDTGSPNNNNDQFSPSNFDNYEDWVENFVIRNPGDYHRATRAEYENNRRVPNAQIGNESQILGKGKGTPNTSEWGMIPGNPGVFGNSPMQQVGDDPLSKALTGTILSILENQGALDEGAMTQRYEQQREWIDRARRSQLNQAKGELSDRNLLSVPGIDQGPERGAMRRIEDSLAPVYSGAMRDILIKEEENADNRLMGALGLGNERQGMLSEIALGTLDRNMGWNKFLAMYGLERSKVMYELQNGNVDALLPLIQAFVQQAQTSAAGYQGDDD